MTQLSKCPYSHPSDHQTALAAPAIAPAVGAAAACLKTRRQSGLATCQTRWPPPAPQSGSGTCQWLSDNWRMCPSEWQWSCNSAAPRIKPVTAWVSYTDGGPGHRRVLPCN